jgi:hypothetical protein
MTKRKADEMDNSDVTSPPPTTKKVCWEFDIEKMLAEFDKKDEEDRKKRDPVEFAIWIHFSDRKLGNIDGKPPYRFSLTGPAEPEGEWSEEFFDVESGKICGQKRKPAGLQYSSLQRWLRVALPFQGGDWFVKYDHKTLDKAIRAVMDDLPDACRMYVPAVQNIILGYLSLSLSKLARLRYELYTGMIAEPYDWNGNLLGWPPEDPKSDVIVFYDTDLLIDISKDYK